MTGKNPSVPPSTLDARVDEFVSWDDVLWRVHATAGPLPTSWDSWRTWGPLEPMRWDPMPEATREYADWPVLYASTDWRVSVAEVFQRDRQVRVSEAGRALSAFRSARPLRLLDVAGTWALRYGATASLYAEPRRVCRAWAREMAQIVDPTTGRAIDGIIAPSAVLGTGHVVVLFGSAHEALPTMPEFSQPLAHPVVVGMLARYFAPATGWPVLL